jgi:hypothetical protein
MTDDGEKSGIRCWLNDATTAYPKSLLPFDPERSFKSCFGIQRPHNGSAMKAKASGIVATLFNSNGLPNFGKHPNVTL